MCRAPLQWKLATLLVGGLPGLIFPTGGSAVPPPDVDNARTTSHKVIQGTAQTADQTAPEDTQMNDIP